MGRVKGDGSWAQGMGKSAFFTSQWNAAPRTSTADAEKPVSHASCAHRMVSRFSLRMSRIEGDRAGGFCERGPMTQVHVVTMSQMTSQRCIHDS